MENQLAKFSVTELKAWVYDELAKAEQAQADGNSTFVARFEGR